MGLDGDHGVDCYDGAVIACGAELRSCGPDGGHDLVDGCLAELHEFIAYADGVDGVPGAVDLGDEGGDVRGEGVEVEEAGEELDG